MTTDATRNSHAFSRKRSAQQLVLRRRTWCIVFCGPQAQETKYWDLKHSKSVAAQAGHLWVHLLFLSVGESRLHPPTCQVSGQFHTLICRQSATLVVWGVRQSACCH